jgi:hypothetical protein
MLAARRGKAAQETGQGAVRPVGNTDDARGPAGRAHIVVCYQCKMALAQATPKLAEPIQKLADVLIG